MTKQNLFPFTTAALMLVLLSAIDAAMTICHIKRGAIEMMPTMRWALSHGDAFFVFMKMGLTTVGALYIILYRRLWLAKVGVALLLVAYVCLIIYHVVLVVQHW